jgi:diaminohydroxyphosphoribosylaminopyrimidine deaminase/5-amino-6-(5-phosphoribosylamino)uracil reductase
MTTHEAIMKRCLGLAAKGRGKTAPNPMVGAVVVKNGKIIAEGYHRGPGKDHAEVDALKKIDFKAQGATLYVNLEPCCFFGHTPPCVDAIIQGKINKVVVGIRDENPKIRGRGVRILRQAGIAVVQGVLKEQCTRFNEVFLKTIQSGKPFVTLKWGQTLNAMIGLRSHAKYWINQKSALIESHKERAFIDAICCGIDTVLSDNPFLLAGFNGKSYGKNPLRVILDSHLKSLDRPKLHIFSRQGQTLLFCSKEAARFQKGSKTCEIIPVGRSHLGLDLQEVLDHLGKRQVTHLEVEGGATLLSSFIQEKLFDKIVAYISPRLLTSKHAVPLLNRFRYDLLPCDLRFAEIKEIAGDLRVTAYPHKERR